MPLKKIQILIILIFICSAFSFAQQVVIDSGIQVEGLWCFPLFNEEHSYYYLPSRSRLALNKDSLPEFSFMRYMVEKPNSNASSNTIMEADGGGILHFLVTYDTPKDQIEIAQKALRKQLKNEKIILKGPVIFEGGRYALISSILLPGGEKETKLIGTGEAPVLENSKIAFSFEVDPMHSKLLLESFKMATPDISLIFELSFSGLTESYEAELEIDWEEVSKSKSFGAGGSLYFVSADIEVGFDELRKNHGIKLTTVGDNERMESLLNTVYNKLLELMFQKVELEKVPKEKRGGLEKTLASVLGEKGKAGSRNTTGFGFGVSYRMKQLHTSGKARLTFNGRSTVHRNHFIAFNIGDLYQKHGQDERIFKDVPLWDPAFQQREVYVGIDGNLAGEFDRMVNNVTVTLKKQHENGTQTTKQLLVNKKVFYDSLGNLILRYLNHKDMDRLNWLNYQYQANWQFTGGGSLISDWKEESSSMINLYTPFRRQSIGFEGDLEMLKNEGVRAISIQITYPFFNEEKRERILIRPGDNLSDKNLEITLPSELEEVDYRITWIKSDGTKLSMHGKDSYGLIFIDEMPEK
jgi:hypothetical protein